MLRDSPSSPLFTLIFFAICLKHFASFTMTVEADKCFIVYAEDFTFFIVSVCYFTSPITYAEDLMSFIIGVWSPVVLKLEDGA